MSASDHAAGAPGDPPVRRFGPSFGSGNDMDLSYRRTAAQSFHQRP